MEATFHPCSLLNEHLEHWRGGTSWFGFQCGRLKESKHALDFKMKKLRCVSADYQAPNRSGWIMGCQCLQVCLCFPHLTQLAAPPLPLTGVKNKQMESCVLLPISAWIDPSAALRSGIKRFWKMLSAQYLGTKKDGTVNLLEAQFGCVIRTKGQPTNRDVTVSPRKAPELEKSGHREQLKAKNCWISSLFWLADWFWVILGESSSQKQECDSGLRRVLSLCRGNRLSRNERCLPRFQVQKKGTLVTTADRGRQHKQPRTWRLDWLENVWEDLKTVETLFWNSLSKRQKHSLSRCDERKVRVTFSFRFFQQQQRLPG